MVFSMVCCQGKFHVSAVPVPSTSDMLLGTGYTKVSYDFLAGHDKSQTGPILKIYNLIFSKKHELHYRIVSIFFSFRPRPHVSGYF